MIRPGEALVFLSLAAGLHVGVWSLAGQPRGAGGEGGALPAAVALAVATPQQSALMRDWQAAPDMTTVTPAPSAPPPATPPRRPGIEQAGPHLAPLAGLTPVRPAAPPQRRPDPLPTVAPAPAPPAPAPPRADRRAGPARSFADETLRPKLPQPGIARPDTPPRAERTAPPPPARTASPPPAPPRAASAGGGKADKRAAGTDAGRAQGTGTAARDRAQAEWGARIQRKVHRRMIYPRGATGGGTARVALTVDRAGRLTALRLIRSSGGAAFDRAALEAVRRAGRFPPAPDSLTRASYTFSLSLAFRP